MKKAFYIIAILLTVIDWSLAQTDSIKEERIRVRIHANLILKQIQIVPETYGYSIFNDSSLIAKTSQNVNIKLLAEDSLIRLVINNKKDFGLHKKIYIKGTETGDVIRTINGKNENTYYNDLEIYNVSGSLLIVNNVVLDYYISGVIEAEGGFNANMEFYKTQAIICRTYTLSHLRRHETEGYQLCDNVHCQVYPGRCRTANMLFAALATKDLVIIDENNEYITASFHANCGGMTVNSEDVWSKAIPYLRAVRDTYCLNQFRATWEEKFSVYEWESYLKKMGCITGDEKSLNIYQLNRKIFFENEGCKIPLKQIRADFNLRSTYFTMSKQGEEMIVKGRGSGHGVGLCQAGAKRMAELGFSTENIIKFYYKGVNLVNRKIHPVYYPKSIKDN